jgi:hypothetical protein
MDEPLHAEPLGEVQTWLSGDWAIYVAVAAVAIVVLYVLWKLLGGKRRPPAKEVPDLTIDVMALGNQGPPPGAAVLEHYNVPVRLAAIVVAPAGRVRQLPPLNQMDDVYDAIVPGLARVVATHRPLVRRWPAQLSAKGFAHTFFAHAKLPGQAGKGTPWCSAAGMAKVEGQPFMAGLVMRTGTTSSHGQEIIGAEGEWLRILAIKGA